MEIAQTFDQLWANNDLEQAADMLSEDFSFSNSMWSKNKQEWMRDFTKLLSDKPAFDDFQEVDGVVCRRGKKRLGMMNISLMESWEFTEDGKIKSISSRRA